MRDEIYRALSNPTRRRVLRALRYHDYPIEAPSLGAAEAALHSEGAQNQERELFHIHLPKLDEANLIEWDREREVIEKGLRFEDALPLLDTTSTNSDTDTDCCEDPGLDSNTIR